MPTTDEYCLHDDCSNDGRVEFCGYCAEHWLCFSPAERDWLREVYVPDPPEVVVRVRTVYPMQPRIITALLWLWRTSVAGVLTYLLLK